jgi:hypothetical protein
MIFTKEQFESMGSFSIDDFPFDWNDESKCLELFNHLPSQHQGTAVSWGLSDTVFRDDTFELLVKVFYGMSVKQFYNLGLHTAPHVDLTEDKKEKLMKG